MMLFIFKLDLATVVQVSHHISAVCMGNDTPVVSGVTYSRYSATVHLFDGTLMICLWYGEGRVGWGGVGGLITFKYTSTHTRHATLLHVPLALAHTRHATLLHVSLALAHTRHATLLHVPLALAHIGHATAQNQLA